MNYLDLLARFGAGSAHPGGFSGTLEQLEQYPIKEGSRILEVGCGTGRTACYLSKQGYEVVAVDIRKEMIEKALRRAAADEAEVTFLQADANELPFADGSFDVVLAESVTLFAGPRAFKEYNRVLVPGGRLFDRELLLMKELDAEQAEPILTFFGIERLYSPDDWCMAAKQGGLAEVELWNKSALPDNQWEDTLKHPDFHQMFDDDVVVGSAEWEAAAQYEDIMARNRAYLGYGVIIGTKG
ncbi:class I SAM-dependent methyltransferase [Paenibacillus thermotolerans]|uniref:class I SAM-dependent methyltransferase n=1 Tax=Paenibacillus thermotolerans TaxID=3027807 RepID=UPI002367444E|nr:MULTISPECIES: class I SAM-dependent methyltransferase [unclassified Paenibacillus]